MFGTQAPPSSVSSTHPVCTLANAHLYPIECQLSSVSSFLIAAESQTIVFGFIEIVACILMIIVVFVEAVWPFIAPYCSRILPLGLVEYFETMNWTQFGAKKQDESEVVVGDLF